MGGKMALFLYFGRVELLYVWTPFTLRLFIMKYTLIPFPLSKDPDTMVARPYQQRMHDLDSIIEEITRPGSVLKETETRMVLDTFFRVLQRNMAHGEGFQHPVLSMSPQITGTFTEEDPFYNPKKHKVEPRVHAGPALRKMVRTLKPQLVETEIVEPIIKEVYDFFLESRNDLLQPGGILQVKGKYLKIVDESDEREGVFFYHTASKKQYRAKLLYRNTPLQLELRIPDKLPEGTYFLEIQSRVQASHRKIRHVRYSLPLVVGPRPTP